MEFYMAPLQSYTTVFYRRAHALTYGKMHKYFTPFFEDTSQAFMNINFDTELNSTLNKGLNVIPQVATNNGTFLIDFAFEMRRRGFSEININMGCPFPMLVKRQRGGGILGQSEKIDQLLNAYFKANINIKISVKMRLGIVNISQGHEAIEVLNNYPLSEIIIHPRLVTQKYTGTPDWSGFAELLTRCKHKVVANGDINSEKDLNYLKSTFKSVNAFMLGRGLLTNPQLFSELNKNNTSNTTDNFHQLHQNYYKIITSYYPDWNQAFNYLQSFWHYPLNTSTDQKRLLRKLKKHNKPDLYNEWTHKALLTLNN